MAHDRGARGFLFSFATICPEVVERHQIYAGYGVAPRSNLETATGILCACPQRLVHFGGGYRLGRLLGSGT
jgi:hypothetical protein